MNALARASQRGNEMAESSPFDARGDFIAGEFAPVTRESGCIALEDPGDLSRDLGQFPFSHDSVDVAVAAARRAYPGWRDTSAERRAEVLLRFKRQIEEQAETLATVISTEVGKPLWEARTEVRAMQAKIDITLNEGMSPIREYAFEIGAGQHARCRAHPRGVIGVLGPFNFPGHLTHGHVAPALATGNTVVIKPSERTPAVGQLYAELALRAGFPAGVFNLIQGDGEQGAMLARHPDLDAVLFTGSYRVGRSLLEATIDQPSKLVVLEMGGKNGALVCEDADLDAAAAQIVYGATITTGQRCSATSRVIVSEKVADALAERLASRLARIRIGYATDPEVFMGPLISRESVARHRELLGQAAGEAECIVRGGPVEGPRAGYYVRPSLHRLHRRSDSAYQTDEHFVPDLAMLSVRSLDEGITALDATPYGLVASVFSRDRSIFERVYREVRVGLLNWNTSTVGASSRLPFGGVKRSGNAQPAGVLSSVYCTYPVASTEFELASAEIEQPGFPRKT